MLFSPNPSRVGLIQGDLSIPAYKVQRILVEAYFRAWLESPLQPRRGTNVLENANTARSYKLLSGAHPRADVTRARDDGGLPRFEKKKHLRMVENDPIYGTSVVVQRVTTVP